LRLSSIIEGFEKTGSEVPILLPLHPRTRQKMAARDLKTKDMIQVIDPVSYFEMIFMLENCTLVMTDSGGLQKEAFFFKKPCITLRDETEWVELVDHGFNMLAGAESDHIYNAYKGILETNLDFSIKLYGDGKAGKKIVKILVA
jgi:UDP-GlcNAc3NAcA epimerase